LAIGKARTDYYNGAPELGTAHPQQDYCIFQKYLHLIIIWDGIFNDLVARGFMEKFVKSVLKQN
jgi:hypothetical protein